MIEVHGLVKRYGGKTAVNGLTFTVQPGVVTGFLGPNGAGKSTTMRVIVGLDRPTAGRASVNGRALRPVARPAGRGGHPAGGQGDPSGLSACQHLLPWRPPTVSGAAGWMRSWTSPGWRRWLANGQAGSRWAWASGWASPPRCWPTREILILDEPVNGLDIEGVRWVRHLLKDLAREGRTVFVSSHLMSEMAQTADHLIVIGRGELIADTSVTEFIQRATVSSVRVRTPEAARLRDLTAGPDVTVSSDEAARR